MTAGRMAGRTLTRGIAARGTPKRRTTTRGMTPWGTMMAKLWEKTYSLDSLIEAFTVADDPVIDARLVNADCVASMAHATMLSSIGILSKPDRDSLCGELGAILDLNEKGRFSIQRSDEDVHTAIENHLVRALGDAGKRIHTGRSRNDQVLTALRLWNRGFLFDFQRTCLRLAARLLDLAQSHEKTPMPGRTHMQTAMPSSVGLWAAAYAEELLDDITLARCSFAVTDCCPLGSAASYGVPLPLDRQLVSDLLGFARVQNNVLYANNSRGKFEAITLEAVEHAALTFEPAVAGPHPFFPARSSATSRCLRSCAPGRASCRRSETLTGWSWSGRELPPLRETSWRSRALRAPFQAGTTGISKRQRVHTSGAVRPVSPACA